MPVAKDFTRDDLVGKVEGTELDISSALSRFHRGTGNLKVVGKRGLFYVYQLDTLDPPPPFSPPHPHASNPTRKANPAQRHVLKSTDFDTVDIHIRKNDIDYSPTGRLRGHLPEMQSLPSDRIARNFQEQELIGQRLIGKVIEEGGVKSTVFSTDYGVMETSVIAHMQEQAAALPQAITGLCKALAGARLDMLKGFTETELLAELARRAKDRRHVQS